VRRERKSDEKEREINSLSERNCIGEIPFAVTESYIFVYSLCGRCRCCEGSEKVIVPAYWRGLRGEGWSLEISSLGTLGAVTVDMRGTHSVTEVLYSIRDLRTGILLLLIYKSIR
jgi:hypothetical protein